MKNPFFIIILLILCISSVQGATVLNSIHRASMTPGGSDSFIMTMRSDIPEEIGKPLIITMDGNCSSWVTTDKASMDLTAAGTPIKASIKVPSDATNGFYQCAVQYTAPASGMVTSRIEVPIKLTITGGKQPTLTQTPAPTAATPAPTRPEMKAPAQEVTTAAPAPTGTPPGTIPYALVLVGVMLAMFGIIVIHDIRRAKK